MNFELRLQDNPYAGKLIAFTGIKGTGKTTLINTLVEYLNKQGIDAVYAKQHNPEYYEYPLIKKFISDAETVYEGAVDITALTLISLGDALQKLRFELLPLLQEGRWVLLDRYVIDQVAGFGVFSNNENELSAVRSAANLLIRPDIAFLIDIDSGAAIQRILSRDHDVQAQDIDRNLYALHNQLYLEFAAANGWKILSGMQSPEQLAQDAIEFISKQLFSHSTAG
jgi:dTMP kinase